MVETYIKWAKRMAEDAIRTYVSTALGLLIASPGLNMDTLTACLVAAIPAALSVVQSFLATGVGDKGSASFLKNG